MMGDSAPQPAAPKKPLYRSEALAHQRERAWGELVVLTPWFARIAVWLICVLAAAFVAFLSLAEYTRKARSFAVLNYAMESTTVAATDAGTVVSLAVGEGDRVVKGQRIATISTERMLAGEAIYASSAADAQRRKEAANRERRELEAQLSAQTQSVAQRAKAFDAERGALAREIAAQTERVAQLQLQVDRLRQLAKDRFVSEQQVQAKQDERAEQLVRLETLRRNDATLARDAAQIQSELPLLQSGTRTRIAALDRDAAMIVQQSREELSRRAYDVSAAADAVVERIVVTPGQTVAAGMPLVRLQAGGGELHGDLFVPTRAAGFLKVGQPVRLAVDAFPFERYGHVEAEVKEIGRVVLMPGEVGAPPQMKEPAFRVRTALNSQHIAAHGERFPLRSGLTANADVLLDKRPLYRWVVEPLIRLRGTL